MSGRMCSFHENEVAKCPWCKKYIEWYLKDEWVQKGISTRNELEEERANK